MSTNSKGMPTLSQLCDKASVENAVRETIVGYELDTLQKFVEIIVHQFGSYIGMDYHIIKFVTVYDSWNRGQFTAHVSFKDNKVANFYSMFMMTKMSELCINDSTLHQSVSVFSDGTRYEVYITAAVAIHTELDALTTCFNTFLHSFNEVVPEHRHITQDDE